MKVTYRDLNGEIVIIDLDAEDGVAIETQVEVPEAQGPVQVTFDEALAEVLQVLPDIDPKVRFLLSWLMIVCAR